MTTVDRHLFRQFVVTFSMLLVSLFSLFVVGDLFDNVDEFTKHAPGDSLGLFRSVGAYYGYQSFFIVELLGQTIVNLATLVTLIVVRRRNEFVPLLAAGVSMGRLLAPLVAAALFVNLVLAANRELVIPRIAHHKHEQRGSQAARPQSVRPTYDPATEILLGGRELLPSQQAVLDAEIVLPQPAVVKELTTLKARAARFLSGDREQTGWLLHGAIPAYHELPLTAQGRQLVRPGSGDGEILVLTAIDPHLLSNQDQSTALQSSWQLLGRLRRSTLLPSRHARKIVVELHRRCVEPLLSLVSVLAVSVLLLRRETSLMSNIGLSVGAAAAVLGAHQLAGALAGAKFAPPALASWLPVVFGAVLVTWNADRIRT